MTDDLVFPKAATWLALAFFAFMSWRACRKESGGWPPDDDY